MKRRSFLAGLFAAPATAAISTSALSAPTEAISSTPLYDPRTEMLSEFIARVDPSTGRLQLANAAKGTDSSATESGLGGAAEPLLEKRRFSSRLPGGTWISADKKLTIDCTGHVLTFIE